ncbi:MAG: Extracellular solute-binding protein family 1 [Mycobacterium sp.]|jgi:hypothetical protein|nr:Extracellular solute-binding protein family 1 [Mycobacterium sp.]
MTTVSTGRSTRIRRRVNPAVGTAAAVTVAAAAVSVGAHFIAVTPPAGDTSPYCAEAYQCIQPDADSPLTHGLDPLVPYGPAIWNSRMPSGPVAGMHTGGAV